MNKPLQELALPLLKEALNSRVAELLVALTMIAMVMGFVAEPLQRIPMKMDEVILRLADLQQELLACGDTQLTRQP